MKPVDQWYASDRARQIVTVAAALAQAVLPTVMAPRFSPEMQPPDVIEPEAYTFAVWVPIFGSSLAYAAAQTRPGWARNTALRDAAWPLAAAFAGVGAWAPFVARSRFWPAQGSLLSAAVAAEHARRRLAASDAGGLLTPTQRLISLTPASLLAAWAAAASTVQLAAMVVADRPGRPGWPTGPTGAAAVIAATALATTATATTPGGRRTFAARVHAGTTIWALAGIAIGQRRRKPATGGLAAIGAATVLKAAL